MATLRHQFQAEGPFRDEPYRPSTLDRVEIEEDDSGASVETVQPSDITNVSTGVFDAEVDEDLYDDGKAYIARWYYLLHGETFESTQYFDPVVLSQTVQINFRV
jgi:hypothetical protein